MLDPAIVTGQLSNSLDQAQPHTSHTADSPPSWITANLEQLTAEPGRSDILSELSTVISYGGDYINITATDSLCLLFAK